MADFRIKTDNHYSAFYRNSDTGFSVGYYTKKEMKDLFPNGGIRVVGQFGYGKEKDIIGSVTVGDTEENVYIPRPAANKKVVGYVELEDGTFIAVKKNITALIIFFILLGLTVLAALIAGITYAIRANTQPEEPDTTRSLGVVDIGAELGEGQVSVPEKTETKGKQIKINGIAEMNLAAGQLEQNFVFYNPEENPCYFQIEIELRDTGEVLYTSNLLPPGYHISKFSLNRALDAGEYPVVVHFNTFSFDKEQRPLNNMDIKTIIKAS